MARTKITARLIKKEEAPGEKPFQPKPKAPTSQPRPAFKSVPPKIYANKAIKSKPPKKEKENKEE